MSTNKAEFENESYENWRKRQNDLINERINKLEDLKKDLSSIMTGKKKNIGLDDNSILVYKKINKEIDRLNTIRPRDFNKEPVKGFVNKIRDFLSGGTRETNLAKTDYISKLENNNKVSDNIFASLAKTVSSFLRNKSDAIDQGVKQPAKQAVTPTASPQPATPSVSTAPTQPKKPFGAQPTAFEQIKTKTASDQAKEQLRDLEIAYKAHPSVARLDKDKGKAITTAKDTNAAQAPSLKTIGTQPSSQSVDTSKTDRDENRKKPERR